MHKSSDATAVTVAGPLSCYCRLTENPIEALPGSPSRECGAQAPDATVTPAVDRDRPHGSTATKTPPFYLGRYWCRRDKRMSVAVAVAFARFCCPSPGHRRHRWGSLATADLLLGRSRRSAALALSKRVDKDITLLPLLLR